MEKRGIFYYARIVVATMVGYLIGFVVTVILTLFTALLVILNILPLYRLITFFWSRFVFWIFLRPLHVQGRENLIKGRSYLVVSNHGSYFDIPAIMSFQTGISWVARESLFRIPVFGFVIRKIGCIAIDSKNFLKSSRSIAQASNHANNNRSVGIFPEGTRSPDGKLRDFKRGFLRILRNSDLDLLPVTLNGFYTLWPRGSFLVNPAKKLEIVIHPPIPRGQIIGKSDSEVTADVKRIIESSYRV